MTRAIVSTVVALLGTGIVILGFAALLRHTVFFYTADGYMSSQTAVSLGLMRVEEVPLSGGLAFRKTEDGGYDFREEMARAFIDPTSHTNIDLVAGCESLGNCRLRKWQGRIYVTPNCSKLGTYEG
ncbi:hypothetical protein SAMN05216411_12137 [Nitrosospira multiformis]|jgi:hypothetical protein|nr:hypothetical protein SAMN05216411_12137 [Nitrosospira multiformis]